MFWRRCGEELFLLCNFVCASQLIYSFNVFIYLSITPCQICFIVLLLHVNQSRDWRYISLYPSETLWSCGGGPGMWHGALKQNYRTLFNDWTSLKKSPKLLPLGAVKLKTFCFHLCARKKATSGTGLIPELPLFGSLRLKKTERRQAGNKQILTEHRRRWAVPTGSPSDKAKVITPVPEKHSEISESRPGYITDTSNRNTENQN